MHKPTAFQILRLCVAGLVLIALGACSVLRPTETPPPVFYSLDSPRSASTTSTPVPATPATAATLVVSPPRAAAGFDSQRIIYLREPYKLEYFANSEWVDPPARMLGPLVVKAIEGSGAFRAVIQTPGAATGDMRLDTQIIRLQHEFDTRPSHVRFTLRAYLVDDKTRRVLAWREFDADVPAASDDAYGGVVAVNKAVQTLLAELAAFCAEAARNPVPVK